MSPRRRRPRPSRRRSQPPHPPAQPAGGVPWRAIRWALILETVVMVAAAAAAGLAAGGDPRPRPLWPLLLLLIPVAAGLRESLRRSRNVLTVIQNMGGPMVAVFVTGIVQLPLVIPLGLIDEDSVPFALVAIASLILGGFLSLVVLLLVGLSAATYRSAPLGTGVVHRSLGAAGSLFLLVVILGVVIGTDAPGGGERGAVLVRLIWAEPAHPFWLWTARIGALGLIGVAIVAFDAIRRRRRDRRREMTRAAPPKPPGPRVPGPSGPGVDSSR
ncbi:hypothetical protein [Actinoplanes sp. NPDC049118]|uniref:hypothetical protein n=1 Tax=Actinoplanes sp. NPDC049118 TaxID=3155769 RepID=UPI0033FDB736